MFLAKKRTEKNGKEKLWDQQCILEQKSALSQTIEDHQSRRAERVLLLVSVVTTLFVVAELVGGYLAHSLAVITDAFHMLSDLGSFIVSILALRLARRSPTTRHSFGFQRAEVLGALSSILVIWVLTGVLLYLAVLRIIEHDYEVEPDTMMITASIGVLFNLFIGALLHLVWRTAGSTVVHAHAHSHSHTSLDSQETNDSYPSNNDTEQHQQHNPAKHSQNLNIRAALVHVLGDLVQSMGVLVAAVLIKFTGFALADPICTFLFSVLVLLTTCTVFRDTLTILMEASPRHVDHRTLYNDLIAMPGVLGVHSLRVWSLKMDTFAATVHLELAPGHEQAATVVAMAQQRLVSRHRIRFVTIQTQCVQKDTVMVAQLEGKMEKAKEEKD